MVAATERLRVVVVDNDQDTADTTAMLVRMWGHDAAVAYSGKEALEQIPAFRPNVALVDLGMPDMTGYELIEKLHAQTENELQLLFALTGNGMAEDRELTSDAGFDLHLTKPVPPEFLQGVLEAVQKSLASVAQIEDASNRNKTLRQATVMLCKKLKNEPLAHA